jgi:hypothetical protein
MMHKLIGMAVAIAAAILVSHDARGAIVINSVGTYTQDFTGFTAFDADAHPAGWSTTFDSTAYRGFTTNGTAVQSGFAGLTGGSITSGGVFSWGQLLAGPPESIGASTFAWQGTGTTANMVTTVLFTNNTGATLTDVTVSFDVFQWRKGAGGGGTQFGRLSTLNLAGSGNLTGLNAFNFTAANQAVSTGTAQGRAFGTPAPADFTQDVNFSQTLTGLSIANGDNFSFSFTYNRGAGTGSAQGIALGNFSVTAVPEPSSMAILSLIGGVGVYRARRRFTKKTSDLSA